MVKIFTLIEEDKNNMIISDVAVKAKSKLELHWIFNKRWGFSHRMKNVKLYINKDIIIKNEISK